MCAVRALGLFCPVLQVELGSWYVRAFPLFSTVFKNHITGGTVGFTSCKYLAAVRITGGFIPVCHMYFTTSALTYIQQFMPNFYDGATCSY